MELVGLPESEESGGRANVHKEVESAGSPTSPDSVGEHARHRLPESGELFSDFTKNNSGSNKRNNTNVTELRKRSELRLQTSLSPDILEKRCKRLLQESRTAIEETGSNIFHLALGFIEWYEDANSSELHRAPLILIPATIERGRLDKRSNLYSYIVSYTGEDIETNLSLAVKLDQDFNLILPELDEEIVPEEYFKQVSKTVKSIPRWKVIPDMVFGMFAFAKILMYKDLDTTRWPANTPLIAKENLNKILLGTDSINSDDLIYSEEYKIDSNPWALNSRLVLDADSSQHSALIDALHHRRNMAIEGPPGTGKSQTITNLIASALNEGLSVLFVAEKKAALDVVRHRLDKAGLGDFCLELHSHKTQKGQLHKDIGHRIARRFESSRVIENELADLNEERNKLLSFSNIANSTVGPNKEKVVEIFWILESARQQLKGIELDYSVRDPLRLSREQIRGSIRKLEDVAKARAELPDHIIVSWKDYTPKTIFPGDEDKIHRMLTSAISEVRAFMHLLEEHSSFLGEIGVEFTIQFILQMGGETGIDTSVLNSRPNEFDQELSAAFVLDSNLDLAEEFDAIVGQYQRSLRDSEPILENLKKLTQPQLTDILHSCDQLVDTGYGYATISNLQEILGSLGDIVEDINILKCHISSLEKLYQELPFSLNQILDIKRVLNKTPPDVYLYGHPDHLSDFALGLCKDASRECKQLADRYNEMSTTFKLKLLPSHNDITELIKVTRIHHKKLFAFLSADYRRAKRSIKTFLVNQKFVSSSNLLEHLENLIDIIAQVKHAESHKKYISVLGSLYSGIDTNWNRLYYLISWTQELRAASKSQKLAEALLKTLTWCKDGVVETASTIEKLWSSIFERAVKVGITLESNANMDDQLEKIKNHYITLGNALKRLPEIPELAEINTSIINTSAKSYLKAYELKNAISVDERFKNLLAPKWNGVDTDRKMLNELTSWVRKLKQTSGVPGGWTPWLLSSETKERIQIITEITDKALIARKTILEADKLLESFGTLRNGNSLLDRNLTLKSASDKLLNYTNTTSYLVALSDYHRLLEDADTSGLEGLTKLIHARKLDFEKCEPAYTFIVYDSMAKALMKKHFEIASFTRTSYENSINRFVTLDKQIMEKTAAGIAHNVSKRMVPRGTGTGLVRDYTEFSLIRNELTKKKRHIPIRQLVRRAGGALQALKPCFMMSPLSVAQYLAPGMIEFDVVVMDEASQIRPADAIGAIARAKQLVIVGDANQLPPTSFFERLIGDELGDDTFAVIDTESILDVCASRYPKRRLRWHYRSEHESLIAFSNKHFYDDDLVVFPSSQGNKDICGVWSHYIEGATYLKGRNKNEAKAVVNGILNHLRSYPKLSLGVATFNREQSELIHDILEDVQKKDSWLERMLKESENSNEPFFIKNLENVQGDERDVIFISTTYGPDPSTGQVYQRFGPILEDVGWRRLNVIVTRAKKRVEVFTSMKSSDVRLTDNSSRGVQALRAYLEYAEKGMLVDFGISDTGREPESDFEVSVAQIVNGLGYKVVPQVGVAGFFIDLGVRYPDRPAEYMLGIECDGAAYHSAASVRDRDRLRQEILEKKGWRIHRIWSVDWYKNRDSEVGRLRRVLGKIMEQEKSAVRVEQVKPVEIGPVVPERAVHETKLEEKIPTISKDSQLKEELILYNKSNILPRFPDTSKGILRSELLLLFVLYKPTTRNDFYQTIPLNLRERTEGKQMQFLDDIFEIIEAYSE
jgi:very-short-patch-repair endonuclease